MAIPAIKEYLATTFEVVTSGFSAVLLNLAVGVGDEGTFAGILSLIEGVGEGLFTGILKLTLGVGEEG